MEKDIPETIFFFLSKEGSWQGISCSPLGDLLEGIL
jgi:hypothetical protein